MKEVQGATMVDSASSTDTSTTDEDSQARNDLTVRMNQLESLVEEQQRQIDAQRKRLANVDRTATQRQDDSRLAPITRRRAAQAGGMLALLGLGTSIASADPQGQVGTASDPLQQLYTEALEVTGSMSVTNLGASVYLSSFQTIPDSTFTTVEFDTIVADHFGGYDTSTGEYTIPEAGAYHVDTAIAWLIPFAGGVGHFISVKVNGFPRASLQREVPGASSESALIQNDLSKTLYGLAAGDILTVEVRQATGSDQNLNSGQRRTYLTIDKVG